MPEPSSSLTAAFGPSLDRYAKAGLIESWQEVPGRGLVVVAFSGERDLTSLRDADVACWALESGQ